MGLCRVKFKHQFTLEQQTELYNNYLTLQAVSVGLKEFVESRGLSADMQIFMTNFMKNITYKDLKRKVKGE